MPKAGNMCLFCMLNFLNIFVIVLGVGVTGLGVYALVLRSKIDYINGGTCAGGLLTLIIGIIACCGRKSALVMGCYIFFTIILFCAYVGITILYWLYYVCNVDEEKNVCDKVKEYAQIVKYVFLGVDALMVLLMNC